jgi:alcohol dehydrogenase
MQLGACFAGLAIENSMLGAAHALANPLTTHYDVPHGEAVALMLPHVIRFNGPQCGRWYHDLLELCIGTPDAPDPETGADGLAGFVTLLADRAGLATRLSQRGVQPDKLPELAADAAKQWTGTFNPREVQPSDWLELYQSAL